MAAGTGCFIHTVSAFCCDNPASCKALGNGVCQCRQSLVTSLQSKADPADEQSTAAAQSAAEAQQGVVHSQKGSSELRALPMTHGQLLADEFIKVDEQQASAEPGAACHALILLIWGRHCHAAVALRNRSRLCKKESHQAGCPAQYCQRSGLLQLGSSKLHR